MLPARGIHRSALGLHCRFHTRHQLTTLSKLAVRGCPDLRCVLLAYSERNSTLGYCQSMNFICAILLLHMECDDVFWCLAAIVEDILPPHWFDEQLHGSLVEPRVLLSCVKWKLPKLYAHFVYLGVQFDVVTYPW